MKYLWETHMHTAETSRCAGDSAADMVRAYRDAGYHGIIVTDHFVNGYSFASRGVNWQRRMDAMFKGYRAALEAGRALGVAVLPGIEFTHNGADFLSYGLEEDFYRDHADLGDLDADGFVRRVHEAGGFVSQAHPYRASWYLPKRVARRWDIVDAIEVFNGSHTAQERDWDDKALRLALDHRKLQTAGSDAHHVADVGTAGVAFPEAFDSNRALLEALRAGAGEVVRNRA